MTDTMAAGAGLLLVGAMIAGITGLLKMLIPRDLKPREALLLVAAVGAVALYLAVTSGKIAPATPFDLVSTWLNLVLAAVGVREVGSLPTVNGRSLSDLPTMGAGPG